MALSTFLNSLLSELMVQHSSYTIVIKCDRATMPARSLRKRTRPSTRTSSATPCYGRSVSSSAINIRSHSKSIDGINKTQSPTILPVIHEDSSDIVVPSLSPSPSPSPTSKMGVRQMSPCSVLCVNRLPTMSPASARWCPSKDIVADSGLTCPKRRESI
jgi:hypothetical protein